MIEPRDSDSIISEINELNQVIENTQSLSQQFPEDTLLKIALQQDQHRKKDLVKELHLSLSIYLYQFA